MLDFPNKFDSAKVRESANDDAHSREGDLVSDALGVPLLIDEPAPLSDALHIPTLVDEKSDGREDKPETHETVRFSEPKANAPQPLNAPVAADENKTFDKFGRNLSHNEATPQNTNRATTPAGPPRSDAWSWIGVPSNHPQTKESAKLAKLDKVAVVVGALITIGPLFAAMVGRMGL